MNLICHYMRSKWPVLLSRQLTTQSARKPTNFHWDAREVRISKTIFWLLQNEFVKRADGYVPVKEVLMHPLLCNVDSFALEHIVRRPGQRFHLIFEPQAGQGSPTSWDYWWIRTTNPLRQTEVEINLRRMSKGSTRLCPTAVYATSLEDWEIISQQGISTKGGKYITLGSHIFSTTIEASPRSASGAQVFIYIDLRDAMEAGLVFYRSKNGDILTKGNEAGIISPSLLANVDGVQFSAHNLPIPQVVTASTGSDPPL